VQQKCGKPCSSVNWVTHVPFLTILGLAQARPNYFRGAYCVSVQDDIISNDFTVKRNESEYLVK